MRPLHLREWPILHTLWKLGHGTADDVLDALMTEHVADRHSVRATLQDLTTEGYVEAETTSGRDREGERVEITTYSPIVGPEDALRTAWPELRERMLDRDRYLEFFRELVANEP